MVDLTPIWSVPVAAIVFAIGALIVVLAGTRLSGIADRLADRTGMGEALMGALLLGMVTSLPGITASVTAAAGGNAELALSNAFGGIAAQTAFLAIADIVYRKANLEHAAASVENLVFATGLVILLSVTLWGMAAPEWTIFSIHPATYLLLGGYGFLLQLVRRSRDNPMWQPRITDDTEPDEPDEENLDENLTKLWVWLIGMAVVVIIAGWAITRAGESIAQQTGINTTAMGAIGIAIATSLPELVTSIAAVRRGALTLAVGGVLGGNAFDCLFAAMADVAYREGSIYHHASLREVNLIALVIAMTGLVIAGLLQRQRSGPGGIGFESAMILVIYVVGILTVSFFPPAAG